MTVPAARRARWIEPCGTGSASGISSTPGSASIVNQATAPGSMKVWRLVISAVYRESELTGLGGRRRIIVAQIIWIVAREQILPQHARRHIVSPRRGLSRGHHRLRTPILRDYDARGEQAQDCQDTDRFHFTRLLGVG